MATHFDNASEMPRRRGPDGAAIFPLIDANKEAGELTLLGAAPACQRRSPAPAFHHLCVPAGHDEFPGSRNWVSPPST
jgi:hypothetical protein